MSTIHTLRNHLEMVQQSFSNALTYSSPRASQPTHISIPLLPHQLATIEAMKQNEIHLRNGRIIQNDNVTTRFYSFFSILGNTVGSGKTLTVLGHISQMNSTDLNEQTPVFALNPKSLPFCFSIASTLPPPTSLDTLIVVPHTVFNQWKSEITTKTTLTATLLHSFKDIDKDSLVDSIQKSHITLISASLFPHFMDKMKDYLWKRVVYDDADNLKIPGTCPSPQTLFIWFVTPRYSNLLLPNSCYNSYLIRQLAPDFLETLDPELKEDLLSRIQCHPNVLFFRIQSQNYFKELLESKHPLRGLLVVRCSRDFIHQSFSLPPLIERIIRCKKPNPNRNLESSLSDETLELLHSSDIQGALNSLGVSIYPEKDLLAAVTELKENQLTLLNNLYQKNLNDQSVNGSRRVLSLVKLDNSIQSIKDQLSNLKERLSSVSTDVCSICFDQDKKTSCLTPCCSKLFCGSCILEWLSRSNQCPLCRVTFNPSKLIQISSDTNLMNSNIIPTLPNKFQALLKVIKDNPEGRFLVYSRFENIFDYIKEKVNVVNLRGNKDSILKSIERFEKGDIRVILMDNKMDSVGLNIHSATHFILMHKLMPEEKKNILGRAFRLGRTQPLHVIQLFHENE